MRSSFGRLTLEYLDDRLLLFACDVDVLVLGSFPTRRSSDLAAQVQALAVQADGKIIAAGQAGGNGSEFALARWNHNGTLDPRFGSAGEVTTPLGTNGNSAARGVAIQADGKILVAGSAGPGGSQEFALARYTLSGSLDATFGDPVSQIDRKSVV